MTEDRIVAAELAIAQVAENAEAVRGVLRGLAMPPLPLLEKALCEALQPDWTGTSYALDENDLPDLARRLLTAMAGETIKIV